MRTVLDANGINWADWDIVRARRVVVAIGRSGQGIYVSAGDLFQGIVPPVNPDGSTAPGYMRAMEHIEAVEQKRTADYLPNTTPASIASLRQQGLIRN